MVLTGCAAGRLGSDVLSRVRGQVFAPAGGRMLRRVVLSRCARVRNDVWLLSRRRWGAELTLVGDG
jgi:hypothetical protein